MRASRKSTPELSFGCELLDIQASHILTSSRSVVAVFTSLLWAAAVYRLRQARLDGNASELREAKERKMARDLKAAKEGRRREALVPDKNWVERLTSWS
jgi:hypothetical protein